VGDFYHLVFLKSSGKQDFIFQTTKRRENVGASELIYRLRCWAEATLAVWFPGFDADRWAIANGDPVEVISASGGTMSVVVEDPDVGRRLIAEVTRIALHAAPGLDVHGVLGRPFDWNGVEEDEEGRKRCPLAVRAGEVRAMASAVKAARPGPATRFGRLPLVAECAASGLPASDVIEDGDGPRGRQARSASSLAKRANRDVGLERLAEDAGLVTEKVGKAQAADILGRMSDFLGEDADWAAVIHVDGNNLGKLFRELDLRLAERNPGDLSCTTYAKSLRSSSEAVDECTREAFRTAFEAATAACRPDERIRGHAPVLPLVLGGDDLTVVCLGRVALMFVERFLTTFEEQTSRDPAIGELAPDGRLTACAGIAVVKPHFPFSAAYELAEELTKEAKTVVKAYATPKEDGGTGLPEVSAFSFHLLHDSGGSELKHLRRAMSVDGASLVAQPYVTTPDADAAFGWVDRRHYEDLVERVGLLTARGTSDDGASERRLPTSQVHDLRSALFAGKEVAEGRFAELLLRYDKVGLDRLTGGDRTVFFDLPAPRPGAVGAKKIPLVVTGLLDAMQAVPLLPIPTPTGAGGDDGRGEEHENGEVR
jgi:hypothetical protein